jgi:hypothetical protein
VHRQLDGIAGLTLCPSQPSAVVCGARNTDGVPFPHAGKSAERHSDSHTASGGFKHGVEFIFMPRPVPRRRAARSAQQRHGCGGVDFDKAADGTPFLNEPQHLDDIVREAALVRLECGVPDFDDLRGCQHEDGIAIERF